MEKLLFDFTANSYGEDSDVSHVTAGINWDMKYDIDIDINDITNVYII